MEKERVICINNKKCCNKESCLGVTLGIIAVLFTLVVGLIIGSQIATLITESLAAIIVLAAVLGIMFVLNGILLFCKFQTKCK